MTIKLNLKDKSGKVFKTVQTQAVELRTGTIKRLVKEIDPAEYIKSGTPEEMEQALKALTVRVLGCYDVFEAFILEIFQEDGLTQEDLDECTTPADIAEVIFSLIVFTVANLSTVGENLKNLLATANLSH